MTIEFWTRPPGGDPIAFQPWVGVEHVPAPRDVVLLLRSEPSGGPFDLEPVQHLVLSRVWFESGKEVSLCVRLLVDPPPLPPEEEPAP